MRSKSGAKAAALWAGQWDGRYNSQSEADSALVFVLAFYTKDFAQLDRLFRQSGLMRDKWDELHGERTYGRMTIENALAKVTAQWTPPESPTGAPAPVGRGGGGNNVNDDGDGGGGNGGDGDQPLNGEPPPGTLDPETGRLILSTTRTLPTARAFVDRFHAHRDGRTLHYWAGVPMAWRANRYAELEPDALRGRLLPWLHAAVRATRDPRSDQWRIEDFPANPAAVEAALASVAAHTHLPATTASPAWLGRSGGGDRPDPREILPCRSCLLHLPTMRRLPPTPAFFAVNATDCDVDPDAPPPAAWLAFLDQVLGADRQAVELLQDWFGYCLTGDTSQQKMLLTVGPKRSGKGTIARVLTQLVGPGNVCGPTTSSLAGPFGLQPLLGKSLAIVSDARFAGDHVGVVVERLLCVSGEDGLTVDRKHLTSVHLRLPTRFMFLTNELPRLADASGALAGRFMMIRMAQSFYGREDRRLGARLLGELPGILNWAIAGWRRLNERGHFVQPASVEDALRDMEDLASPVGAFVRDRCEVQPGKRVWVDDLYAAWRAWCDQDGRAVASTKQTFGRDLMAAVAGVTCRRNSVQGRFYDGIGLAGLDAGGVP